MAAANGLWVFVAMMVGCRGSGLLGFVVVVKASYGYGSSWWLVMVVDGCGKVRSMVVIWGLWVAVVVVVLSFLVVMVVGSGWQRMWAALGIVSFVGYLFKLALALVFHFIGDPITSIIRCIETALYAIRALHSAIAAYTPVPELTTIILLASAVLAIVEVASPNSVNSQTHLLTVFDLIGYAAVCGYILEPFFWTLLLLQYGFSRFVKKKDNVSSALPVAAMLAAVGEPWVRVLVIAF
ncbi:hypothetical protein SO802_013947 [Lithocarpus litseifolius]|uniref:Uncharacterized protein n=1 Tax=Lithocarpus litseifolius TaxID=425828 RepID=A0AAW2D7Q4_9ROSI